MDYLDEGEIKDVCRSVVSEYIRNQLNSTDSITNLISNIAYKMVWEATQEKYPEDLKDMIAEKIPTIVEELSSFTVFRKPDAWDREASKGWTILQEELDKSKELIRDKVRSLISNVDMYLIKDVVMEQIDNVIDNLSESRGK
jgi:hypothetical protein